MNAELDRLDAIRKEKLARYEELVAAKDQAFEEYTAASQAFSAACEKDREEFTNHPMWEEGRVEKRLIKQRTTRPLAA